MKVFSASVRWRMTLWYSVSIAAIYFLFAGCVFLTFRYSCIAESRMRLSNELMLVTSATSHSLGRLTALEADYSAIRFHVLAGQQTIYASHGWTSAELPSDVSVDAAGYGYAATPTGQHYAIVQARLQVDGRTLQVGVAQDDLQTLENLHRLLWVLLLSLPGILVASLLGGYFLAGRILSPIDAMARKAQDIGADHPSQRLPLSEREDEFNRLARVFNDTFDRMEDSFNRMKRFTADASHELRTPLAIIRSLGENALQRPRESISCHEETLGSILEEVERLTRLLDGLLILTRADSQTLPLQIEETSLSEVSQEVVHCLRVLAEEKTQSLLFQEQADLKSRLDKSTFKQALINLLANAIQYTQAGGSITVRVRPGPGEKAWVEVDDNGPGIAPEHRLKIFERFYRVDKDRSKATGGSGLGLAIAQWAIELNGGTMEYEAKQNGGSIFRIELPCL